MSLSLFPVTTTDWLNSQWQADFSKKKYGTGLVEILKASLSIIILKVLDTRVNEHKVRVYDKDIELLFFKNTKSPISYCSQDRVTTSKVVRCTAQYALSNVFNVEKMNAGVIILVFDSIIVYRII